MDNAYINRLKTMEFPAEVINKLQKAIEEVLFSSEELADASSDALDQVTGVTQEDFDSNYEGSADYDDAYSEREDIRAIIISKALSQIAEGK